MRLDGTPLRPEYVAAHENYKMALNSAFRVRGFTPEVLRTIKDTGNTAFLDLESYSREAAVQLPPSLEKLLAERLPGIPVYPAMIRLSHDFCFIRMGTDPSCAKTPNGLLISKNNFAVDPWVIFDLEEGEYSFFEFSLDTPPDLVDTDRTSLPISQALMGDLATLAGIMIQREETFASSHIYPVINYPEFLLRAG